MITFAVEPFSAVYDELYPLLVKHYHEISHHHEHGYGLNPQVHVYRQREADGSLMMAIGRENGKIIAYFVCFVAPGLHYADCLTCLPDIFFVAPEYRKGGLGLKMFTFVKRELKRRGVKLWFVGSKNAHNSTALFRRMGFKPVEETYSMWLED